MYQHTQYAWVILGVIAWVASFLGLSMFLVGTDMAMVGFAFILVLVAYLFYSLTVSVTDDEVKWHFGPGLIKKRLPLSDIESVAITSNSWRHGWGIRITHDGWIYSVSGFAAVALTMKDNTVYRIGSNDAENLAQAIQTALDKK